MKDAAASARLRASLVAAAGVCAVAAAGGLLTDIGPWYYALRKPSWQPPDWAFGPAWTLIFALTAIAAVLAWEGAASRAARARLLWALAVNGALNVLWSALFFRLRRPDWALLEVVLLWLSIVVLMAVAGRSSRLAPWLLLPYLAWVSFAAWLNLTIVRLNGPFGGT
ncbi:MAG: tryptophan-rich sensory protein [Burkholderiaceae bacterium]|nr:tryptophan-rich sensory protein [Burkholderiaceae bacterium]MCX8003446.1 tryptophan-rich sensory protein [Burkholderiaceae bacterium]